jgi:hypothetical protein
VLSLPPGCAGAPPWVCQTPETGVQSAALSLLWRRHPPRVRQKELVVHLPRSLGLVRTVAVTDRCRGRVAVW